MSYLSNEFVYTVVLLTILAGISAYPEQGIMEKSIQFKDEEVFVPFTRSAFARTALELRVHCNSNNQTEAKFKVQFVVRSSPCDKEFNEVLGPDISFSQPASPNQTLLNALRFYFKDDKHKLAGDELPYDKIWFLRSDVISLDCKSATGPLKFFPFAKETQPVKYDLQTDQGRRRKRQYQFIGSEPAIYDKKPGNESSDTLNYPYVMGTLHPATVLPATSIYLVVVLIAPDSLLKEPLNMTVEAYWYGVHGFISAIDWPLLPFFGLMCMVYLVFAIAWFIVSLCQWRDLLRIQFWIGAVILLGMLEKAVFYAEYQTLNSTGRSVDGAVQLAEIVSCVKKTLSRMLIIIVSVGFGVVKPRLGSTLHKVVGVGFIYFILCSIEGVMRQARVQHEQNKQKQLIALPLTLIEIGICWWIFAALVNTMRALRLRRNEVKLSLYRHFTNTLIFAVLASVGFMIWSLSMHIFTQCLKDWSELWVDTAFWHLLFSVILLVIMILWRPSMNNQRYAFTPLLDDADDDDEAEDTIFSEAFTTSEEVKLRGLKLNTQVENRKTRQFRAPDGDSSLEEDLKWVEEHIPSSLADRALPALIDSDEEREATKFEMSKIQ